MSTERMPRARKWEIAGVGLVTLLAGVLRFWALDRKGLWYDEFCAWYTFSSGDLLTTLKNVQDVHSPGFALLMLALHKFLPFMDDFSIRILPALLGVVSVPLLFVIGKRLFDAQVGLLAAFFLAVAPIHIELSRQVVMYSLLLSCLLASMYFLYYSASTDSPKHWFAAVFFVACTMYSHPFGVFPLALVTAGLMLDGLVVDRAYWRAGKFTLVWVGAALAYTPWLVFRIMSGRFSDSSYAGGVWENEPMNIYDRFREIASMIWQGDNWSGTLTAPLCLFVVVLFACALMSFRRNRREVVFLLSWSLSPLVVYTVCAYYKFPAYGRYLMPSIPAVVLLLALGYRNLNSSMTRLSRFRYVGYAVAGFGMAHLVAWNASVLACELLAPQSPGFRSLARVIQAEAQDNAHVVVTSFNSYAPHASLNFIYRYAPSLSERIYVEKRDKPYARTEEFLKQGKIVWYVVHSRLPDETSKWLSSNKSVYSRVVGNRPVYAVLIIPNGSFATDADRDRYIDHIKLTEIAVYRHDTVHVLARFGHEAEVRYGHNSPQARAYYEDALESIALLLRITPFSAQPHNTAAEILAALDRDDEALTEYRGVASLEFGKDKEYALAAIQKIERWMAAKTGAPSAPSGATRTSQ